MGESEISLFAVALLFNGFSLRVKINLFLKGRNIMSNTNEYAKIFQKEMDKQIVEGATSGWMEENAGKVIYSGGKEIKLPSVSMQGLAGYSRDEGYSEGAITFSYETMTMSQDRGRRFRLDAMDVDEGSFAVTAAGVAAEFQRTKVIPEIDAYRYSALAAKAQLSMEYSPNAEDIYSKLIAQLGEVYDVTGGEAPLVITMARPAYDLLINSAEISKSLDTATFSQGDLDVTLKSINGAVIIPVPSARMMSEYVFEQDGNGGFTPAENAVGINWIICPKTAPIAVSKTDKIKIVSPEQNQFADAWDVDYRKYHDLFVPENAARTVAVCRMPVALG